MRRLVYSVAASLDGFIAGPDGSFDWIPHDPEIDFATLFDRFDTLVMGRRTWEVMKAAGPDPMPDKGKVVVSRTMTVEDAPGARLFGDPVKAIATLRNEPGKDLWLFGGGILCGAMIDAGLVDEVQVAVAPVVLGSGLPLVAGASRRERLRLKGQRTYGTSGIVLLSYDVERHQAGP